MHRFAELLLGDADELRGDARANLSLGQELTRLTGQGRPAVAGVWILNQAESRELIGLNTAFVPGPPSLTGGALGGSIKSNLPSGKAELDYQPVLGTLVYASISRGVKSGGFTAHNTVSAPAADPFARSPPAVNSGAASVAASARWKVSS